jgi:hypothetical protein
MFGESESEAILGEIPIGASGKHGGVIVKEKRQELEAAESARYLERSPMGARPTMR